MKNQEIQKVIDVLESARTRKRMYLSEVTIPSAVDFLGGFSVAASIFGCKRSTEVMKEAYETRGWEFLAAWPLEEMKHKGMKEEEIIDELFRIEIESWKLLEARVTEQCWSM